MLFWTPFNDGSEVWKLFLEVYLILDIKTTIRLQKSHCKNIDGNTIKSPV